MGRVRAMARVRVKREREREKGLGKWGVGKSYWRELEESH